MRLFANPAPSWLHLQARSDEYELAEGNFLHAPAQNPTYKLPKYAEPRRAHLLATWVYDAEFASWRHGAICSALAWEFRWQWYLVDITRDTEDTARVWRNAQLSDLRCAWRRVKVSQWSNRKDLLNKHQSCHSSCPWQRHRTLEGRFNESFNAAPNL